MNTIKKCPHCKLEVDPKASRCPHCHGKIYVWTLGRKIVLVAIPLFVIMIVAIASSDTQPSAPVQLSAQQVVNVKKSAINSFARSYVRDTLKSPSTAKFSTSPVVKQDEKDTNSFEVMSYVDSQNSYGATLRNTWSLKAHYIGEDTREAVETGENWRIDEFYFDGKKIK